MALFRALTKLPAPGLIKNHSTAFVMPQTQLSILEVIMTEKKNIPKKVVVILTGILFALYAVYNVLLIIRDYQSLPPVGIVVSVLVALFFAAVAFFAFTTEVMTAPSEKAVEQEGTDLVGMSKLKNIRFLVFRDYVLIIALVGIFALKLRVLGSVISYFEFSELPTVFNGCAYVATQVALLLLIIYYVFFLKKRPFFPRTSVLILITALVLFVCGFALEIVLYIVYGIGLEASPLRTMLSRPVFYLSFIGLSVYFLFPPLSLPIPIEEGAVYEEDIIL